MKVSALKLPKPAKDFLKDQGYTSLYPPQVDET